MGLLHEAISDPLSDVEHIGVGIYKSGGHIGLLYKIDTDSPVRFLHFCFHRVLHEGWPKPECTVWVEPTIEPEQAYWVIANAMLVWEKNRGGALTYGFSDPRGFFDTDGNMIFGPAQVGLTCATFVLAVFDLGGKPLLQIDTWQSRADDAVLQERLVNEIALRFPHETTYLQRVRGEIGSVRCRPLEVAGGALAYFPPIDFDTAKGLAAQIKGRLS